MTKYFIFFILISFTTFSKAKGDACLQGDATCWSLWGRGPCGPCSQSAEQPCPPNTWYCNYQWGNWGAGGTIFYEYNEHTQQCGQKVSELSYALSCPTPQGYTKGQKKPRKK